MRKPRRLRRPTWPARLPHLGGPLEVPPYCKQSVLPIAFSLLTNSHRNIAHHYEVAAPIAPGVTHRALSSAQNALYSTSILESSFCLTFLFLAAPTTRFRCRWAHHKVNNRLFWSF